MKSRKLEDIITKYGKPVFKINVIEDKSMIDEDLHDITDIPSSIKVFLLPENRRNVNQFTKYIVFCNYDNKDNWYPNTGKATLIKLLLEKELSEDFSLCKWESDLVYEIYQTSCNNRIDITEDIALDFDYCPFCRKMIKVK